MGDAEVEGAGFRDVTKSEGEALSVVGRERVCEGGRDGTTMMIGDRDSVDRTVVIVLRRRI